MTDTSTLDGDLQKILNSTTGEKDGAELLPADASVEPGALLHRVHEAWKRQDSKHTFQGLVQKLKDPSGTDQQSIQSLQHKLKGRLSTTHPEARDLLKAMFKSSWSPGAHWSTETADEAAKKVADVMFGPIYGIGREEVRIVESPGMNTAKFMEEQRKATAVVFPVDEQAMYGEDPTDKLYGTLVSLAQLLGKEPDDPTKKEPDELPYVIYVFRPRKRVYGEDYARYLYERSSLAALFSLVRVAAENKWDLMPLGADIRFFPRWKAESDKSPGLAQRLCVWILPSEEGTDIMPYFVPERWKQKDGMRGGFEEWGFLAVMQKGELCFWKFRKSDGAFSKLPELKTVREGGGMVAAYRALIGAVKKKRPDDPSVPGKCWSAAHFIQGRDLELELEKTPQETAGAKENDHGSR